MKYDDFHEFRQNANFLTARGTRGRGERSEWKSSFHVVYQRIDESMDEFIISEEDQVNGNEPFDIRHTIQRVLNAGSFTTLLCILNPVLSHP